MLRASRRLLAGGAGQAFMDISIGGAEPRRVTYRLFSRECPMAAENFLKLCTGELALPPTPAAEGLADPSFGDQFLPQLTYRGTSFHRVHRGFMVQGGDVTGGAGTGQLSVFGDTFDAPEETRRSRFDRRGLLGTAVSAPHLNGSQFFVLTAAAAPHLDGTCICFGEVADGWDVITDIETLPLSTTPGVPRAKVTVVDAGKL